VQAPATRLDILYVGDGEQPRCGGQFRVETAGTGAEWPRDQSVDCLLVDTVTATEGAVELVRRVNRAYPSTPLVAFTDPEVVGPVLDAGATDVVRSSPGETPKTLLQQRIENVCETAPVAGVAEHGSFTHEGLLEQLSESLQDVIWVNNPDNPPGEEMEFVSAAYEEVWGRPREHLFAGGMEAFYGTVHPDDRERIREASGSARVEAGHTELTYRIIRPDGEIRWIHDRALGVGADSETSRFVGISRDITERKHREQDLTESEETVESLLSEVPMVLFTFDADGVFTRSQGQALEHFNLESGDLVGISLEDVFAHRPDIREHCRRALGGEQVSATVELGGRTFESRYQPLFDDREVERVVGHAYDITDRIEQQHQLERQNDLFVKAQEIADVGAWEYRPDGSSLWTEKVYDIYQLPEGTEPTLETARECYHPADWPRISEALEQALEHGEAFDLEVRLVTETDDPRWVHLRGDPQTANGAVTHLRGTVQRITERKERERELERSREFLDQIQQVGDIGGWEYCFHTDTLELTEATCRMLDLPSETTLGAKEILESHHPEDREQARKAVTRLWTAGEPFGIEVRVLTNGETLWMYSQAEPVYEDGEVVAMRGVTRDITERKQREQQLQAERDIVERVLETSPVGILVHDADRRVTRANEKAAEIMGVDVGSLEGRQTPPEGLQILSAEGEPRSDEEAAVYQAKKSGEPVRDRQFVLETPDDRRIIVADAVPLFEDGDLQRIVSTFDDVTERVERERRLESQRNELARLDRINRIIRNVDAALVAAESRTEIEEAVCEELSRSGPYHCTMVFRKNGEELSLESDCRNDLGAVTVPEIPRSAPAWRAVETGETQAVQSDDAADEWTVCRELADSERQSTAAIPLDSEGQTHGVLVVCSTRDEALSEREIDVLDELGSNVGYAIGAIERREREATLTSLYEATQDLLAAENPEEVSDVVVETAASVLDPSGVGIFLFDDEENVLDIAASTERLREFYDGEMAFGPGRRDSITWQTYVGGERQFFFDIRASSHVANPDTEARTALFLPLGEHGVFVVATDERVPFGEEKRRLVGLLGATTEAALDRVTGRAEIRERDRRLAERSTRLERLERLFSLVGDIDEALRRAGTSEELERQVCSQLVDTEPFEFAWVGVIPPDGSTVEPRTWADGERSEQTYLDAVSFALDGETPAARAARKGEPVAVPNVTNHLREADWARAAVEQDYESVLAVPLTYEDVTYGVLAVYATEPHAFDSPARAVFDRLGTLVPQVSTGLQRDRTVLGDRVVELELSLPDPGVFPNAVAATVGEPVEYRQVRPTAEGRTRVMFALADPPIEALREVEQQFVSVESLDVVERSGMATVRATVSGSTAATRMLSCGAIPDKIVARADSTTATVRLPHDADVRLFLERVDEHYPGVELVSRRDVRVRDDTEAAAQRALAEDLTDRQREVLRTAYEHGFFESPRATTGVELADLLGVSQPTVTHHLREAQRRLFDALFETF
jgi:PAS domain S-box-containing protein